MNGLVDLLAKHRLAIIEAITRYTGHGVRSVRVIETDEWYPLSDCDKDYDVDVLLNFDKCDSDDVDVIICIHTPERPATESFCAVNADAELVDELETLLGCSVDIVDEPGLQSFYPNTYDKMTSTT